MKAKIDYRVFIENTYNQEWKNEFNFEAQRKKTDSDNALKTARLYAQRKAIDKTFVDALLTYYPEVSEKEIWGALAMAHKLNVANLNEFGIDSDKQQAVFEACLSAHQSWIKSSGHSFERYISNIDNDKLKKNEIRFILQSELTDMVKKKKLANTDEDIHGLNAWGKDFDLYAIQTIHGDTHVFGCIQSKTSIRDRVGRDVTFSRNAMEGLFWSVGVTLDGDFLNMDEFIHMVNGGGSYRTNGWHGMYAMSGVEKSNDRIYKVDDKLDIFVDHAILAAKQFISDRRLLNNVWKANSK